MAQSKGSAGKGLPVTFADIKRAAEAIEASIVRCDIDPSRTLSEMLGARIWLKFENLQFTASFKERGALNKLLSLSDRERATGVIAMSAGNHAQGVAYHARNLGIRSVIVMPQGTPFVKIDNTGRHGAEVIVHGANFEEAGMFARRQAEETGLTFVHPYDDPLIIAGQGTIALEMLTDVPELDTLVVPIGGGGLISGIAIAAKAMKPSIEIIGVQSRLFPSMYNIVNGTSEPAGGDTLAEGIAVKSPGSITQTIVSQCVDEIMLVDEPALERAVVLLIEIEKTVVEGAGAAGLAAILTNPSRFKGKKVGLVLSGGNIDSRLLASVLTRGLARAGRLSELAVDMLDRPGQLARLAKATGDVGANIVEISHQRVFTNLPAKSARARIVLETRDARHLEEAIAAIKACGLNVEKVSE